MPAKIKHTTRYFLSIAAIVLTLASSALALACPAFASADGLANNQSMSAAIDLGDPKGKYYCGNPPGIQMSIDIGCSHKGNPVMDMTFAIIRFLSMGVGLVLVGSMVWAGIQYTASRGDPQATAAAVNRIRSNVTALLIFIFAYAILNYVVPGQLLK